MVMGGCDAALGDPKHPGRRVSMEHCGILCDRNLPDRLVQFCQLDVSRSPVGGFDLLT